MSPAESAAPALCRVALLVGEDFEIDYSLPAAVALIAVTEDLVARVNEVLGERGRPLLDAEQSYRLCRADAQPLDPQKTLDECGVLDGEQLWLLPAAWPRHTSRLRRWFRRPSPARPTNSWPP